MCWYSLKQFTLVLNLSDTFRLFNYWDFEASRDLSLVHPWFLWQLSAHGSGVNIVMYWILVKHVCCRILNQLKVSLTFLQPHFKISWETLLTNRHQCLIELYDHSDLRDNSNEFKWQRSVNSLSLLRLAIFKIERETWFQWMIWGREGVLGVWNKIIQKLAKNSLELPFQKPLDMRPSLPLQPGNHDIRNNGML